MIYNSGRWTAEPALLRDMARSLFRALEQGVLRPAITQRYSLGAAADAHRDLEARRTTGSIVLLP